jgi:hypothetical protein
MRFVKKTAERCVSSVQHFFNFKPDGTKETVRLENIKEIVD